MHVLYTGTQYDPYGNKLRDGYYDEAGNLISGTMYNAIIDLRSGILKYDVNARVYRASGNITFSVVAPYFNFDSGDVNFGILSTLGIVDGDIEDKYYIADIKVDGTLFTADNYNNQLFGQEALTNITNLRSYNQFVYNFKETQNS